MILLYHRLVEKIAIRMELDRYQNLQVIIVLQKEKNIQDLYNMEQELWLCVRMGIRHIAIVVLSAKEYAGNLQLCGVEQGID